MPGGQFAKTTADWFSARLQGLNGNNANDTVIGGAISTAPSGLTASQGTQTQPGDRVIFGPMDAVAMQNNNVGNLYTGSYRYVQPCNSTANPARGHAGFWVPIAFNNNQALQDALYQVTADEVANYGVSLFAGVFINSPGKGNNNVYWWMQESGKVAVQFRTTISGTPAIAGGVYLSGAGNNANAIDVGSFDQISGLNSGTTFAANTAGANSAWTAIDSALVRLVGVAEQLPSNNNISVVDLFLHRAGFRW
jgi:hypothetical protein